MHRNFLAFTLLVAVGSFANAAPLQRRARVPIAHQDLAAMARDYESRRSREPAPWGAQLVVKFRDEIRARARDDGSIDSERSQSVAAATELALEVCARFRPLIQTDEVVLAALEARAAVRSGCEQPDLAGMLVVEVGEASAMDLAAIGERFQRLPCVEFASLSVRGILPPGDIAPPTPDLVANQNYRVAPPGLDAAYMAAVGATGAGVRLSDCEFGWIGTHEDLVDIDIHPESGQTPSAFVSTNGWDHHGTAVLGVTSAVHNAYGCSGLVPDAAVYTYPVDTLEQGARTVTCIANAVAASSDGDVVLLEIQTNQFLPAEVDPMLWAVVKSGTDAGVVVVAAAGNGGANLDNAGLAAYQALGDSGAIMVGAGSPDSQHEQKWFSNYGSRVNLQGWGGHVFTLGYGGFATYGGDPNQTYTDKFNGTSAASPFVASACVAIQSWAKANLATTLTSIEMRNLLVQTGIAQGPVTQSYHIGPFPDVQAAIEHLACSWHAVYCTAKQTSGGCSPSIGDTGTPHLTSPNSYVVTTVALEPQKHGLTFFGVVGRADLPFQGGTMCVTAPRYRLATKSTGGSASCSGTLSYTLAEMLANASGGSFIGAGGLVCCQTWTRDPAAPFMTSLSNALEFYACP